jgi:hypothetical protein
MNANPPLRFGDGVERSMNAFTEQRTTANALALLDEIDKSEPNSDEGVMSGPTVTVTVTITITITIKAKDADDPDDPETDPEVDPE